MNTDPNSRTPDFNKAQHLATQLLLRQNIDSLKIDVRSFKFDQPVCIDSIQHYSQVTHIPIEQLTCYEFSGCCFVYHPRCSIILYDDDEPNEHRKHWGIAHEIGHMYLGHTTDGPIEEIEANYFAAQIIMPEIVLVEIAQRNSSISTRELCDCFNASLMSAQKRITTLERRCCWSSSDDDMLLLQKFMPLIDKEFPKIGQIS